MLARRLLLCGCFFALFLVLALALGGPVMAMRVAGMTVARDTPQSKDFGPIAGNAGPSEGNICGCAPAQCDIVTYCDTVPLTVKVPQLGPSDDFFVRVVLSWDYRKVEGVSQNNLDMRVYDKAGATQLARAQGAGEPEVVTLYRPVDNPFYIIVVNGTGVNTGYNLNVSMIVDEITPLFEVGEESGPPQDLSGEPEVVTEGTETPLPAFAPSTELFGLAPIEADAALEGLSQQGGQLDRLLTPPTQLLNLQDEDTGPPPPVSTAQVLVWGGIVPACLVAAGFLWVRMRGSSRLEVA